MIDDAQIDAAKIALQTPAAANVHGLIRTLFLPELLRPPAKPARILKPDPPPAPPPQQRASAPYRGAVYDLFEA